MKKQTFVGVLITLFSGAIIASAKSYVDVEKLKTKVETLFEYVKETRQDVKDIKQHLLERS